MNHFVGLWILTPLSVRIIFLKLLIEILLKTGLIFFKSSLKFNDVDKKS